MRVTDIIHGRGATVDLRRTDGDMFPANLHADSEVFLQPDDFGEIRLRIGQEVWDVEGITPHDRESLRQIVLRRLHLLAWLVQADPVQGPAVSLLIEIREFPAAFVWNEAIDFGVDDKIVDDLRKRQRVKSIQEAVKFLKECILLPPRAATEKAERVLLSGSPSRGTGKETAFRLFGKEFAVDIKGGPDNRLRVTRIVASRQAIEGDERYPIYLATGTFRFCDLTIAGQFRGLVRTELDYLVAQSTSYLDLWKMYNEREKASVLRRAREFGWIRYSSAKPTPDVGTWRFHINVAGERQSKIQARLDSVGNEQLEASEDIPAAIQSQGQALNDVRKKGSRNSFVGELKAIHHKFIDLQSSYGDDDNRKPPDSGFIFVSLAGDVSQLKRRENAWFDIRSCANPMPQLGLLLEGQSVPERHERSRKPITRKVRKVLEEPNDRQRLALDIALNTPDIALVQGPPGTGKTRVIAALQARLSERDEVENLRSLSGNTLLTSFQHDAVENAAAATLVMGLPAFKVSNRRGLEESQSPVDLWRQKTAEKVRLARARFQVEDAGSSVHKTLEKVREIAVGYLEAPGHQDEPTRVVSRLLEIDRSWLPAKLLDDLDQMYEELTSPRSVDLSDANRQFALKAVRALRTTDIPFSDDGPANAAKTVRRLMRIDGFCLQDEEKACLEQAADHDPAVPVPEELLSRIRITQNTLIDRLQLEDADLSLIHANVKKIIMRVVDALTEKAEKTALGVEDAVSDWLNELENNPDGIQNIIKQYSMVLAATCQQSVNKRMRVVKGTDTLTFRSVIVDEAARANPLDLMIPMSLAERRIILVGDHRQLPQTLEPDIEREIEQSVQEKTHAALRQSLFEKMFADLRTLEQKDGVTRTITLNQQYRMHPLLGQFVSEQFYEPYGEGFGSGLDQEPFAHNVSLKGGGSLVGKVAAWIDVPFDKGSEESRRSKSRPIEAEVIVQKAQSVLIEHPDLSVGIITFYRDQRDTIQEKMRDVGLMEDNGEGIYRIKFQWRQTSTGHERLRVGTVDSFQGKEFDVVFLSLTRSNRIKVNDEATRRRRYGFLLLENRLCVAMSRQKRLLVVVGDKSMASGPEAKTSVSGLHAFREFCEGAHGSVIQA